MNWTEDKTRQNTRSFLLSSSHWYGCRSDVCCTHHLVWRTLRLKNTPCQIHWIYVNVYIHIWAIKQWQRIPNISKAEHRWATRCMYIVRAASDRTQWPCKEVWRRLGNLLNNMYLWKKMTHFMFLTVNWFLQISRTPRKSDCKRIKHFTLELQELPLIAWNTI